MAVGRLIPALLLLILLGACGEHAPAPSAPPASVSAPAAEQAPVPEARQDTPEDIQQVADLGLAGFSAVSFPAAQGVTRETYSLSPEGQDALEVTVLRGPAQGPVVYVVGGIHGDEPAGWLAAQLLGQAGIKSGTLYLLTPANAYGAAQLQRNTREGWDLNRAFPGGDGDSDAQAIAAAIFGDLVQKQPDLVLDLHEARPWGGERDSLGSSLICHSVEETGDLVLELLIRTQAGQLCSGPFTLFAGPPEGSLNRTASVELEVPVITVETDRSKDLGIRVADQLAVVHFLLQEYGLC